MLKKRILAIQAAVVLGVSMLAATTIPVGNIATVAAAESRKATSWSSIYYNIDSDYCYSPGELEIKKSSGALKTGDTIKVTLTDSREAAKNRKVSISEYEYNETEGTGKTIYGERTVNETVTVQEQPLEVSYVETYDETNGWTIVPEADNAKYVTLTADGKATFIGQGKYEVGFRKRFSGTSTFTVNDVWEDGLKEDYNLVSSDYEYSYPWYGWYDDNGNKVPGISLTASVIVNQNDTTVKVLRDDRYYNGFPNNGLSVYDNDDISIAVGETAAILLNPYEPLNKSQVITYDYYDPATDTVKTIKGTRTVVEQLNTPNINAAIEWKMNAGDEKYISVAKGKVTGLSPSSGYGSSQVWPSVTVSRSFKVTNKWDDGITEEYLANEGSGADKTVQVTTITGSAVDIWVYSESSDPYLKTLRLNDIGYDFGDFQFTAEDIEIGKGESKDIANSWGLYVPTDNSNDPNELEYEGYDASGKKTRITGTSTYTETNISIKHKYTSSDENVLTVDEETGKITGVAAGEAVVTDKATVRSTFTLTYKWSDGKTQSVTSGEVEGTVTNKVKVTVADTATVIKNGDTITDAASKGKYIVYTKTKTATFVAPTDKNAKTFVVPETITVNNEKYTVKTIKAKAFSGMKKLTKVTVKAPITIMGDKVFYNCAKLTEVDLTKVYIDTLTEKTFSKSKKLAKLTINGNRISNVEAGVFDKNPKIKIVVKSAAKSGKADMKELFKDAGYTKLSYSWKKLKN